MISVFHLRYFPVIPLLTFLSGRNKIIKHLGKKMHSNSPKLEANIANTSTATVNLPGELT